ncbi:MAG: hypothetical protein KDK44_04290 [Chlamydiia bacterium]|nr:hypothetical protein [Chlamydiia bacterium]MCP5509524.1 hypothetical protein [Chlamydiales bacterium]
MNVLPFVLIILALFATLSSTLLTKGRSVALEHKAYKSYMDAERSAKASFIQTTYSKIPVPKNPHRTAVERTAKPCKNWRQQSGKRAKARLNIYALLQSEDPPPHLQKTFLSLMDELYARLPIYVELKAQGRLSAFFNEWKKANSFADIAFDDPDESLLFYKICKGCHCYDTEQGLGYPPLEDFICIERLGSNKPMPWRLARPPLLRAYFGDLAGAILSLEAENQAENPKSQSTLTREELEDLLKIHPTIPRDLLSDAVGNSSDTEILGASDLTQVRHLLI